MLGARLAAAIAGVLVLKEGRAQVREGPAELGVAQPDDLGPVGSGGQEAEEQEFCDKPKWGRHFGRRHHGNNWPSRGLLKSI